MKAIEIIPIILALLLSQSVFSQTPVYSLEPDSTYVICTKGGHRLTVSATEFLNSGSGAGDNLGNHIATQDIDMQDFNILHNDSITWRYSGNDPSLLIHQFVVGGKPSLVLDNTGNTTKEIKVKDSGVEIFEAYTLPTADGTSGQVMQTDGLGVVTWADVPGDNLGNHTATQALDMAGFDINNVGILQFYDFNSGSDTWNLYEKGIDGSMYFQLSGGSATPELQIKTDGTLKFGGTDFPTSTGSTGDVLTITSPGVAAWQAPSGGSGSSESWFIGNWSGTDLIVQDSWNVVQINNELRKDADFTHSNTSSNWEVTLVNSGLYLITAHVDIDQGTLRSDLYLKIEYWDGSTWSDLYTIGEGGYTLSSNSQNIGGLEISNAPLNTTSSNWKIRASVYCDNAGDFNVTAAYITIKKL